MPYNSAHDEIETWLLTRLPNGHQPTGQDRDRPCPATTCCLAQGQMQARVHQHQGFDVDALEAMAQVGRSPLPDTSPGDEMKASSFIVYFDRYGKADWVVYEYGRGVRLTRDLEIRCPIRATIRKHQPRAVFKGSGQIQYSRRRTLITA